MFLQINEEKMRKVTEEKIGKEIESKWKNLSNAFWLDKELVDVRVSLCS